MKISGIIKQGHKGLAKSYFGVKIRIYQWKVADASPSAYG